MKALVAALRLINSLQKRKMTLRVSAYRMLVLEHCAQQQLMSHREVDVRLDFFSFSPIPPLYCRPNLIKQIKYVFCPRCYLVEAPMQ